MDNSWLKVKDFHQAFGHPYAEQPKLMDKDRAAKRYAWMKEEIDEFIESNAIEDQADAMIDLIYFALGTMVELGVKPEKIFDIVHDANMSKLGSDGKPIFNEMGKVAKPAGWQDPQPKIKAAITEQLEQKAAASCD